MCIAPVIGNIVWFVFEQSLLPPVELVVLLHLLGAVKSRGEGGKVGRGWSIMEENSTCHRIFLAVLLVVMVVLRVLLVIACRHSRYCP